MPAQRSFQVDLRGIIDERPQLVLDHRSALVRRICALTDGRR
ncbi:hypothetical protein [Cryptosporangium sp. NPDC048952]